MYSIKLIDKLSLEIKRFKKLQVMFLGKENTGKVQAVDLQHYAKFVLKEGSILEKRLVLECLKSEIVMKERSISIR